MANQRFERHLKQMIENGWDVKGVNPDSIVDDNFAQFLTYWPHNKHITMAAMSVDRFYQFLSDFKSKGGAEFLDATALAGALCEAGKKSYTTMKKDENNESFMGMVSACYMSTTATGKSYLTQTAGHPFSFIAVMYPANAEQTNFSVRPALLIDTPLMSVDDVYGLAEMVMQHDKESGKKEFFRYLKKK